MVRTNSKRKSDDMKKVKILLFIFLSIFYLTKTVISAEIDIYKKIDLFGEVLEKINKEYDEIDRIIVIDKLIKKYCSRKGNSFDCIIGVSGGKDSTRQALWVRDKLNLNPLLVC